MHQVLLEVASVGGRLVCRLGPRDFDPQGRIALSSSSPRDRYVALKTLILELGALQSAAAEVIIGNAPFVQVLDRECDYITSFPFREVGLEVPHRVQFLCECR